MDAINTRDEELAATGPGTWTLSGVSADPSKPGAPPDPYDPCDTIVTAATYLRVSGAPADWAAAIYAHNHAGRYVSEVQQLAQQYAQNAGAATSVPVSDPTTPARPLGGCPVAAQITPESVAKIAADGSRKRQRTLHPRCRTRSPPASGSSTTTTARGDLSRSTRRWVGMTARPAPTTSC